MRPNHPAVKMFEAGGPASTLASTLAAHLRRTFAISRHFAASIEQRQGDTYEGPYNDLTLCFLMDLEAWNMEVRVGIEPTNKGFADPGLTTWLPHRMQKNLFGR